MNRKGEWILWGAAALLLLSTCAAAVAGTPDFAPITVTYSSSSESGSVSGNDSSPAKQEDPPDISESNVTQPSSAPTESTGGRDSDVSSSGSSSSISSLPSGSSISSGSPTVPQEKIHLNTASKEELMAIKGLGEVLAQRIIDYRERYGGFDSLEELMEVDGIGEKRLAAWMPYLTL